MSNRKIKENLAFPMAFADARECAGRHDIVNTLLSECIDFRPLFSGAIEFTFVS